MFTHVSFHLAAAATMALAIGCTKPDPNYNPDAGSDAAPEKDAADIDEPDASGIDAGDSGPGIPATQAIFPPNGHTTGSVHVPITVPNHPLKPKLMWTAVAEADEYQVQLTSECGIDAFRTCSFDSPVVDTTTTATTYRHDSVLDVSTTAPVGRRYYWRVRACRNDTGCSAWTEIRYLDVGRLDDDFNGDGYADVVVGATGDAYIYLGSASGIDNAAEVILRSAQPEADGAFGTSVASAGDVNGDGYADVIIGAEGETVEGSDSAGRAYVYYGRAGGVDLSADVMLESSQPEVRGFFGHSVAGAGDVNGDGYADVIVGADEETVDGDDHSGRAYLYYGNVAGIDASADLTLNNSDVAGSGDFGSSVAGAGDLNGDGYADLVIASLGDDVDGLDAAGRVYVYQGAVGGVDVSVDATLESAQPEASGLFGSAITAAGDINGDGYADIVVGAYAEAVDGLDAAGRVYVYFGGASGIGAGAGVLESGLSETNGYFGISLASGGDVNGDGYDDLVVGASRETVEDLSGAGRAYVYYGAASGLGLTSDVTLDSSQPQEFGYFGSSVGVAGDINGDGHADVVVGAYRETVDGLNDAGRAHLYFGAAAGLDSTAHAAIESSQPEAGGAFGVSVGP